MRPGATVAPRRSPLLSILVAGFLIVGAGGGALAHRTNLTTGTLTVDGSHVTFDLEVSPHDLAVALGIETDLLAPVPRAEFEARRDALTDYMRARLRIEDDGAPCPLEAMAADYADLPDTLTLRMTYICAKAPDWVVVTYRLFFDIDPEHRSLGKLVTTAGEEAFLFDRTLTTLELEIGAPAPQLPWHERFARMLWLGVEHIAGGIDHVLFLLALLIVRVRFWHLAKVVTAFTVAHSLTLALAWYGVFEPPGRLVEVLIAASIAYVAVENLIGRGLSHRWLVAFVFGLVHGLGFYGVLAALDLARTDMATTLVAFNLGVEAGQLAIVAAAYGALVWWTEKRWYDTAARAASAGILLVAGFWIFQRAVMI